MGRVDCEVVVIGAGLSGLVAARRLEGAGLSVQVVAARDRVGGRLLNVEVGGGQVDELGGQFVGPCRGGKSVGPTFFIVADLAASWPGPPPARTSYRPTTRG